MNKKILIGSIIAVAILVLVSFTGVVGYQTTKSSTIAKASPLFTVRSSRAIDEESKDIACDYVGKDREILITLPKRNDRTIEMKKSIDILTKMDGIAFNRFIKLLINRLYRDSTIRNDEIPKIIMALYQLKTNPENIRNELADMTDKTQTQNFFCLFTLGTLIECISSFIFITILFIIVYILWLFYPTGGNTCILFNPNYYIQIAGKSYPVCSPID